MNWLKDLFFDLILNFPLVCTAAGWFFAQVCKVFVGVFRDKNYHIIALFVSTGGMPSAHTSSVTALVAACALSEGLNSAAFAVAAVLTVVVMRDATGVRREVGEQAKVLNGMKKKLAAMEGKPQEEALLESVGHSNLEVFIGCAVGLVVPFIMGLIPAFGIFF